MAQTVILTTTTPTADPATNLITTGPIAIALAPLEGTAAWTPGAVSNLAGVTTTVTVAGAALGGNPIPCINLALPAGCFLSANVTAPNTVTVALINLSGSTQTIGAGTVRVDIF